MDRSSSATNWDDKITHLNLDVSHNRTLWARTSRPSPAAIRIPPSRLRRRGNATIFLPLVRVLCRTRCQSRRRSLHRTRRQLKMRRRLERHPFLRPFRCRLTTPDRPPEPIVAGCWPAWRRSAGFPGAARSKPAEADRRRAGSRRVCVGSGTHPAGAGAAKLIACRPAEIST